MSSTNIEDGSGPILYDKTNYPYYNEGQPLQVFDADKFHMTELLFDNDNTVDILPTISEEGFRDLNDGPGALPDLPVVECKKNFPLRFSRKPKQRLPFPVHRKEDVDTIVDPWMLEPEKSNVSYTVPREMKALDLSENSTFIRWEIYPRITDEDIEDFYKEHPNPGLREMRLGLVDFDFDNLPDVPRVKQEMNVDMLLNYFDDLEIREEFIAKTSENLYNPHLPWFKQKHLTRRGKALARKKLERERIEKGEIVEKVVKKDNNQKKWTPWKFVRGAPTGRGRRARFLRWRYATMYNHLMNEMNKTPGTEDRGRGSFRRTRYRGRRGYRGTRGGSGSWGGENAEDGGAAGWGTGGSWGEGDQGGGYGRSGRGSWRGGRGGWGSGEGRESWGGTDTSGGGQDGDAGSMRGSRGGGRGWGGWGSQSRGEPRGIYRRGVMAGRGRGGGDFDNQAVGEWED